MLQSSLVEKVHEEPKAESGKNNKSSVCGALLDLVVTMTIHLPKEELTVLLNLIPCLIGEKSDFLLQKKAYKLLSRMVESESGVQLLADKFPELLDVLLSSAQKVAPPARRDRLAAFRKLIEFSDQSKLFVIPIIVPEVVLSTRDHNERARSVAFELLVVMGEKMAQGGTITNSASTPSMTAAEDASASLEEYFKIVTAGLASPNQQLVGASITGLARIMYHFRQSLTDTMVDDLVQTIDIFLTSTNREIVRSALGFIKVSVICLPIPVMLGRLHSLIPNLLIWSQEHKARFKSKVKHIFERMIRRFGIEEIEKHCPDSDKRLINNIRKTRERQKRRSQKDGTKGDQMLNDTFEEERSRVYKTELDEVINESDSDSEPDDCIGRGSKKKLATNGTSNNVYIMEDEDDPLDLLGEKALSRISSVRPGMSRKKTSIAAKPITDSDGKLYLGVESDGEADIMEFGSNGQLKESGSGDNFNAYLSAKGESMAKRNHKGMLKFGNKKSKQAVDDDPEPTDSNAMRRKGDNVVNKRPKVHIQNNRSGVTKVKGGRVIKTQARQVVKRRST